MAQLMLQYTSGACSGPLQTYLRSTRALTEAQEHLQELFSTSEFLRAFPHEWLVVQIVYGCADFYGNPTTTTSTVPTTKWKADKRRGEFVVYISIDGSTWELHDKELRKRTHLPAAEISRQIQAGVVSALIWVARIHGLPDAELKALEIVLGHLPGAIAPDDISEADVSRLLAAQGVRKALDLPPLNEALYRRTGNQLEYLEIIPNKLHLTIKRGKVGEIVANETRKPRDGESMKDITKSEQRAASTSGFAPLLEDQWTDLEVIVPIKGFGTDSDNKRKNRIAAVLRDELPARGLGNWTGDSIGSGTFEIGVRVADDSIGRGVIMKILQSHDLSEGVVIEEL